jgi:hypothetical protein
MPECRLAVASSNEVPKPSPEPNLNDPDSDPPIDGHKWEGDSRCELI